MRDKGKHRRYLYTCQARVMIDNVIGNKVRVGCDYSKRSWRPFSYFRGGGPPKNTFEYPRSSLKYYWRL